MPHLPEVTRRELPSRPITGAPGVGNPTPNVGASISQRAPTLAPPANTQEQQQLTSKWTDFLQRPDVMAGLFQFAINAAQPVAPGRSTLGHLGAAVAGGGAAIGRVRAGQRERKEEARKAGLEERRVRVTEEGPKISREAIASTQGTARIDREARRLAEAGRIDAAMQRVDKQLKVQLNIAADSREAGLLSSIITSEFSAWRAIVADPARLPGDPIPPPPTSASIQARFKTLRSVLAGEASTEELVSDTDILAGLRSTDPAAATQWRQFLDSTSVAPEQKARVEAALSATPAAKPSATPTPKVKAEPKRKPTKAPIGHPGGALDTLARRFKTKAARRKHIADVKDTAARVKSLMGTGALRKEALDKAMADAKKRGLNITRAELIAAL